MRYGGRILLIALTAALSSSVQAQPKPKLVPVDMIGDAAWRHAGWVTSITPFDQGRRIVSTARDGSARLWDASTGELLHRFALPGGEDVWHARVLPGDKQLLTSGSDGKITVWDMETGKAIRTCEQTGNVFRMAVSHDGQHVFAGDSNKRIVQWNIKTGEQVRTLEGHAEDVYCVALSPDGKTLASASEDKSIILWNAATGEKIRQFDKVQGDIYTIHFMPDGQSLLSVSADPALCRWNLDGSQQWRRELPGNARTVDVTADGSRIVCHTANNQLHLIDPATGESTRTFKTSADGYAVSFSPDGRHVYASMRGVVGCFDVNTGELLQPVATDGKPPVFGGIEALAVSPDGTRLAVGDDADGVHLWNLSTGKRIMRDELDGSAHSAAFTPDGKQFVIGGRALAQVRNAKDGTVAGELHGPGASVDQWFWTDKGQALIAASNTSHYRFRPEDQWASPEIIWHDSNGVKDWLAADASGTAAAIEWQNGGIRFITAAGLPIGQIDVGSRIRQMRFAGQGVALVVDEQYHLRQFGQPAAVALDEPTKRQMLKWVEQLGAETYKAREQATEHLIAAGQDAEQALEQADMNDPEVKMRVERIRRGTTLSGISARQVGPAIELGKYVRSLAANADGTLWAAAISNGGNARIMVGRITRDGPTLLAERDSPHGAHVVKFAPDGQRLYVGNDTGNVSVYRLPAK